MLCTTGMETESMILPESTHKISMYFTALHMYLGNKDLIQYTSCIPSKLEDILNRVARLC